MADVPRVTTSSRESAADLHARAVQAWGEARGREALDLLRAAVTAGLDLEVLNDLAVVLQALEGDDAARAVLATVLAVQPGHADAAANLAALDRTAASWRDSATLGGPDPDMPERAFPGMPAPAVMREHALRYAFTLDIVGGRHVLDLGCGTGYGSEMLTWTAASVRGFDLWTPEAHEVPRWQGGAELTYGHDLCTGRLPRADVAVAFEVIEHLADAPAALRHAWQAVDVLVASFPNPVFHGSHHNPYHVNDWTLDEFERHLAQAASIRFGGVELAHFHQDYRDGTTGVPLPGRDPDSSYWVVVARGTA